jgi:Initiator Replication protein
MILARSNRWGRIRCEVAYAMTTKYAIALYEMICLRANLERCIETIEMEKFRELLGVPPGAYDRTDNFMRNVITPAVLEVNGLSDMGVQIEMVRKHSRAVAHAVMICWWRKSPEEFATAAQERGRSKIGRMARLRSLAESTRSGSRQQVGADTQLETLLAGMRADAKERVGS